MKSAKSKIARRAARELQEGQIVNLGVGIPNLIPNYIKKKKVFLQSENGLLGIGPEPSEYEIDIDLIDAGKNPITMEKGSSLFSSATSFAMIRGNHIDVAVMGGLQIDETGEIANWAVPGKDILGVGGAMDLIAGAKRIIITLTHLSKGGEPKLVKTLTYPTSGGKKANLIITEKAVFRFKDNQMILEELDPDVSIESLRKNTTADFIVSNNLTYNYI